MFGARYCCDSRHDEDLREPLVRRQGSPIFNSICEGELAIALQSLQGKIDLIYACVQDLVFHYWANRDLRVAFSTHPLPLAAQRPPGGWQSLLAEPVPGRAWVGPEGAEVVPI